MKQKQTPTTVAISETLIAPCGMNCALCRAFVREKKSCPGCRCGDHSKSKSALGCLIKNCEKFAGGGIYYCFECDSFPCLRLNRLDKRYRNRYGMGVIENLSAVKKLGIRHFVENERLKWACPECGALLCVHKPECLHCHHMRRLPNS